MFRIWKRNFAKVITRVRKSECVISSLITFSLFLVVIQLSESQQNWAVCVGDSVKFSCNSDPGQKRIWEHENDVLFLNELKINFHLNHIKLLDNYSLLIQEAALQHKGMYRCLQNESIVTAFVLNVEVPPKMFLTINESDNVTNISVEAGTDVTLFCHAVGALPSVNLSWTTDEEKNDQRALNFTVRVGGEYQGTQVFDSVSSYTFTLTQNNGIISCRSKTSGGVGNREISLQYSTFVLPDLEIILSDINITSELYVPTQKPLVATCRAFGSRPASNLFWFIDNLALDDSNAANEKILRKNNSFDTVSTATFTPENTSGLITCVSKLANNWNHQKELNVKFYTYMIPKLRIFIDGIDGIDVIPVAANEPVRVVCNASSSRPKPHLSLLVNNLPIENLEEVNGTSSYNEQEDATFDALSTMWYRPKDVNGSITCSSHLTSTGKIAQANATYFTYVIPDMYFTFNGIKSRNISTINVTSHQMMTVFCHADRARPFLQLRWKLNTRNVDTKSVAISNREDHTFNITTFLKIHLNETGRVIMCFTRGLFDRNIFILANIQYTETDRYQENTPSWKIVGITLVLLLLAAPSLIFALRKYFGSRSSHSLHEYQAHGNIDTNINSSLSGNNTKKRVLAHLDLPEVPRGAEISDYCPFSEDDYDSYFELKDKSSHHRMFRGKDMCLILSMNSGHLRSRWMGTISLSKYHKKCVVFSTVSDVIIKSGEIQWDTYVKRVLDMPDHNSLVKLEGICVNQANLYLVHEHLTCDSLESIINSKRTANNLQGPLPTSIVASYLMNILEGMEVLHSFGFLHPGLSTKKVLVTDGGQCKLYNFFLSEDAPNKTSNMKSKKDCSIKDLPPEALLRNEYTQGSDVWCVAVVIWSLMTYDPIPVDLENLDETKVCKVHEEWPASHYELKNNILFECWNYDDDLRPSINRLRSSFTKVLGNLKAFNSSEDLKESMTDLYIPMGRMKATNLEDTELNGNNVPLERHQDVST